MNIMRKGSKMRAFKESFDPFSYLRPAEPSPNEDWPFVTVIIPTLNCAATISLTIESILEQDYPHYEVVAVDSGSRDRTLEILQSYGPRVRLEPASSNNVYDMINQGIQKSKGEYLNFLFPGDFYIHHHTLLDIMRLASHKSKPELVYCGTLLRDGKSQVKFLFRHLSLNLLRRGRQPTSLQGCWIKKDLFDELGLFRTDLELRGGFDFFCRFCLAKKYHFTSLHRALTDYDLRWVNSRMILRQFWETCRILTKYFGWTTALKWLGNQRDLGRFVKLCWRKLGLAFLGQ